jgi:hypothetical protein
VSQPSFGELAGHDPYDVLELPRGASDAEVRAARKRLLRKYHPDVPGGDLRRTQLITAAADLLLDPLRRIGYYDLRDEESRRTVFATTHVVDDSEQATRPGQAGDPGTRAAQPIRPTFVTPGTRTSASAAPSPRTGSSASAGPVPGAGPLARRKPGMTRQEPASTRQEPASTRQEPASTGQEPGSVGEEPSHAGCGHVAAPGEPAAASRWNALAVASVVSILTWTPVPLVLGLLALRQIRRYGQRGRRLALTGVIAGAVLSFVYLYVLVLPSL